MRLNSLAKDAIIWWFPTAHAVFLLVAHSRNWTTAQSAWTSEAWPTGLLKAVSHDERYTWREALVGSGDLAIGNGFLPTERLPTASGLTGRSDRGQSFRSRCLTSGTRKLRKLPPLPETRHQCPLVALSSFQLIERLRGALRSPSRFSDRRRARLTRPHKDSMTCIAARTAAARFSTPSFL